MINKHSLKSNNKNRVYHRNLRLSGTGSNR